MVYFKEASASIHTTNALSERTLPGMGQQVRVPGVVRARIQRLVRALYPGFCWRVGRGDPLSLLSIFYVLSIIATGVYLTVPLALLPALNDHPVRAIALLVAFSWCILACVVSYLLTACADPGRLPDSWRPRENAEHSNDAHAQQSSAATQQTAVPPYPPAVTVAAMLRPDGQPRYCNKCRIFKPDRAHHCSSCSRCVLQMDHHCPFTVRSNTSRLINLQVLPTKFLPMLKLHEIECEVVRTLRADTAPSSLRYVRRCASGYS